MEREEFKCEFCSSIFKSNSTLNTHQKTAKYCLKIQNKVDDDKKSKLFNCEYCQKSLTSFQRLTIHEQKCVIIDNKIRLKYQEKYEKIINKQRDKYEKMLKQHEAQNKILLDKIENLAMRAIDKPTTTTTNNTTNNTVYNKLVNWPTDLTDEKIKTIIKDEYNEDYMLKGLEGVVEFTYDNIIKVPDEENKTIGYLYVCSDTKRLVFKYKNDNKIIRDEGAKSLISKIKNPVLDALKTKNGKYEELMEEEPIDTAKYRNYVFIKDKLNDTMRDVVYIDTSNKFANELKDFI